MTARPGYQGEDPWKPENGWALHYSSDTRNYNGFWRNRTEVVWTKQREGAAISQLSFGRTMSYGGKAVQVNLLCSKDVAAIGDIQALWLSRSSPADLHAKHQRRFFWVWAGAQLPNKHMLKLSCNKQALTRSKVCEMHYSTFNRAGTRVREFFTCWPCMTKVFYVLQRINGWKNYLYPVKFSPDTSSQS